MDYQPMFKIEYITKCGYDAFEAAVEAIKVYGRVNGCVVSTRRTVYVGRKATGIFNVIGLQCTKTGIFVSRATQKITSSFKTKCLIKISVPSTPPNTWFVWSTLPYHNHEPLAHPSAHRHGQILHTAKHEYVLSLSRANIRPIYVLSFKTRAGRFLRNAAVCVQHPC